MAQNKTVEEIEERYGDVPAFSYIWFNTRKKHIDLRRVLTVLLCLFAAATMILYKLCTFSSCSFLHGELFGIPLEFVGIGFALLVGTLSVLSPKYLNRGIVSTLLSLFVGAEMFLVGYQIGKEIYCPFCLTYGALMVSAFFLNVRRNTLWTILLAPLGFVFMKLFCVVEQWVRY